MAILKVSRLGHPVLRQKAQALPQKDISSASIQRLIDDMIETMREYDGVGIAAPQVHASLEIAVIEVRDNPRYPGVPEIPLTVLINPKLTDLSQEKIKMWEGCLSVPDMRGEVPRHVRLSCEAYDRGGRELKFVAQDFYARVIQHEWDHLQGNVYLDRMNGLTTLSHLAEYAKYWAE